LGAKVARDATDTINFNPSNLATLREGREQLLLLRGR
jgi:hypothetical protein